jgi:hypothetical protein
MDFGSIAIMVLSYHNEKKTTEKSIIPAIDNEISKNNIIILRTLI